jgi:phytoene/squalene synthetase
VLRPCGYSDPERVRLSDATGTALQLANFWQDVTVDLEKDRIYIPLEALHRHGSSVEEVVALRATPAFRAAMREVVDRAQALFEEGPAGAKGGPPPLARSGAVQPRRHACAAEDSRARLRRAVRTSGDIPWRARQAAVRSHGARGISKSGA